MNISPGIVGMYWLLASFAASVIARRAARTARARCCGMCDQ